jgi:hypothetical protein
VFPRSVTAFTSAFASINSRAISSRPQNAAECKAVEST